MPRTGYKAYIKVQTDNDYREFNSVRNWVKYAFRSAEKPKCIFLNCVFRDSMLLIDSYVFKSPRKDFLLPKWGDVFTYNKSWPHHCPSTTTTTNPYYSFLFSELFSEGWGCLAAWTPGSGCWVGEEVGGSVIYFCMPDLNHPLLTKWELSALREDVQPLLSLCLSDCKDAFSPDQKIKAPSRIPNQLVLRILNVPEKSICSFHVTSTFPLY